MTRTVGNLNAPEQEKCPDAKDSLKGKVGVAAHLVEQMEQQQLKQQQISSTTTTTAAQPEANRKNLVEIKLLQ